MMLGNIHVHETYVEIEDCDEKHNTKKGIQGCHTFNIRTNTRTLYKYL